MGICGGGGFLVSAAKIDSRIAALATASMYSMGAVTRNGLRHSQDLAQRKQLIANAAEQRWIEAEGGQALYSDGAANEITSESTAVDVEFQDYYRTSFGRVTPPGAQPNATSHRITSSNTRFMNFYPFSDIDTISPRPVLFVTGDQAHSREFSEDAYARAAEPKEIIRVPGAGHVDLYDRVDLITFAESTQSFRTNLVGPASNETVARKA
ncbi:hypothetical protein CLAFUW4_05990 [Fulvia fulva]|uniref:Alpha/beta hydrolase n=1 Tax=Passalora fulva TaxID=5499 RepID=A0A9Q8LH45_PASFU|nr:uncharacterized protein CLAFUR5_06134 [Fulvia fulva]KAK4623882.1 hypothetical protein CLAFUR4_05995 [Fulvia fulva]KAK4625965.1 hypothetical protein CLAFUR0_05998 [Fulvia fulva]UJO17275.1 hypothetical protein CLAFUR5_06134 [Fulvia fulva]WPV15581.1 hypothetical protein CLAFUW4_05990 [Fulvia fulva]WPV29719.1 hypothetical protein CLAFUW7_05988 [Fulvia fulva]